MDRLNINGTEDTPTVLLDPAVHAGHISGRSLPEDVITFFGPVLQWVDLFSGSALPALDLRIDLDYFNTASSKILLDIFLKLDEAQERGKSVNIIWVHRSSDEDMRDAGLEYADLVSIPFDIQAK